MLYILLQFSNLIVSFEILLKDTRSDLTKTKIKVVLKDGSVIFLREIIIQNVLFDYSCHWVSPNGSLIMRWDNAAHYPDVSTHPHHNHVGSETNIQSSYEQNLFDVFTYINGKLGGDQLIF